MPDYHCALCPGVELQSWQTHIENAQRVHTGCGGPVDDPDLLESLAATVCTWASLPAPREELRLRILRELQGLHAVGVRAGQERMRERAGEVAAAYDRPDRDGRETYEQWAARDIAAAVRALPLEEAE